MARRRTYDWKRSFAPRSSSAALLANHATTISMLRIGFCDDCSLLPADCRCDRKPARHYRTPFAGRP